MPGSSIFINDLVQLNEQVSYTLATENDSEVLISGMYDNFSLKETLYKVLSSRSTQNYKIIVPYAIGNHAFILSFSYKHNKQGGIKKPPLNVV